MCNQNFDFSINWLHGIKDYAIDHALSPTVHDTALLLNIKQNKRMNSMPPSKAQLFSPLMLIYG